MNKHLNIFITGLLLLCSGSSLGQRAVLDSLRQELDMYRARQHYTPDTVEVNLLTSIAKYSVESDRSLAISSITRADSLSQVLNYKTGQVKVLIGKCRVASMGSNDYEEAIRLSREAEELAIDIGRMDLVFDAINNQAVAAFQDTNYELAYSTFQRGIELSQDPQFSNYLSHYQMNIGVIFTLLENHEYSKNYLEDALETHRKYPGHHGIFEFKRIEACILANLGYANWKLKEFNQAKAYSQEALNYFENEKEEVWISFIHTVLAGSLFEQDSMAASQAYYRKNIPLFEYIEGRPQRIGMTYLGLGKNFMELGNQDSAFFYAHKAHTIFTENNLKRPRMESSALLAELFNMKKNIDSAFFYQELSERMNAESQTNLLEANLALKESERSQRIAEAKRRQDLYQKQLRNGIALLVIIIVLIVLFVTRSRMKGAEKTKNQLEELNQLKDQVFKFISKDLSVPIKTLNELAEISEKEGSDGLKQYIPELKTNLDHSKYILTNFHYWTQAHKEVTTSSPALIKPSDSLKRSFEKFKFFTDKKALKITVDIDSEQQVFWDSLQLDQVIDNLYCNAIRFTGEKEEVVVEGKVENNQYILRFTNPNLEFGATEFSRSIDLGQLYRTVSNEDTLGAGIGLSVTHFLALQNGSNLSMESTDPAKVALRLSIPLEP
jgi:signal transduction histidine kinase